MYSTHGDNKICLAFCGRHFQTYFLDRKWWYFESFSCYSICSHYYWITWWHVFEHAASIYPSYWCTTCGCIFVSHHYFHYDDVIMGGIASQITSLTFVYSTVYSDADRSKHQSSTTLAFVWGIHRGPGTGEFSAQMASNAENVSIWWRHHAIWKRHGGKPLFESMMPHFIYEYIFIFWTFCENNGGRCVIVIAVNIWSFKTSGMEIVFSKGSDAIMKFCYSEKLSEPKWLFQLFIERCHGMEITSNFKPKTIMQDGIMQPWRNRVDSI